MKLTIKLYGDLKKKFPQLENEKDISGILNIEIDEKETVSDILNKISLTQEEISHIFVNYKYSGTDKELKNGDRIGIFPKRMGIIFVEITNE